MDDWFICFLSGQNYIGFIILCTKKKGTCCTLWLRCFCIYSVIRVYHLAKMTHQKQRTGKKEDQSHSTVICSVHMVSIRVYIELLKSYSHLIMQLGVALISSDTFLRLQTCRVESQSISSMKRGPQRTAILGISVIEIRGSQTCFSITKPDPVKQVYCPPEWCLSPLRLALSICRVQRNTRSNFHYCYFVPDYLFTVL